MTRQSALIRLFALPICALLFGLAAAGFAVQGQDRAEAGLHALAAMRQQAATGPAGQAERLLIQGTTVGLAQSALQRVVRERLALAGLTPDRLDPAPAEPGAPLMRLPLTLAFAGNEDQVMAALVALEGAEPLLRIDHVTVDGQGIDGGVVQAEVALSGFVAGVAP